MTISLFWWGVIFAVISVILILICSGIVSSRINSKGVCVALMIINFLAILVGFGSGGDLDKFGLGVVITWGGLYLVLWLAERINSYIEKVKKEEK